MAGRMGSDQDSEGTFRLECTREPAVAREQLATENFSKGHVGRVIRGDVGTELICSPHHRKCGVPIDVDRIEVANVICQS